MLIVQGLALIGLTIYCFETYRMRRAAQAQIEVSHRLLQVSLDQVEGLSKPCITFWAQLREGGDVIMEMHGASGNLIARPDGGSYVVNNLGSGLALNVRYYFTRNGGDQNRSWRYIPTIPATAKVALVETLGFYNGEHEAAFEYGSIGGRNYRSTITLNHHVITSFRFEEIRNRREVLGAGE
jgi:hypothetical protein